MRYRVKIKINTDADFVLSFEHPKTPYKYKNIGDKIRITLYFYEDVDNTKIKLISFLRSLNMITHKERLKDIFDENIYQYTEELEKQGLHSNHNLLSGNYSMEVFIFDENSEYL